MAAFLVWDFEGYTAQLDADAKAEGQPEANKPEASSPAGAFV